MSFGSKDLAELTSSEKRALLVKLLEKRNKEPKSFPVSFAQEAIWFFDQLQPGNCLYNMPAALRFTGRLDLGVAEQAANEIVKRHEVIRVAFCEVDGKPLQTIAPTLSLPIANVDLRNLRGREQEEEMRKLVADEIQRPFTLNRAPLLRVTLLRLDDGDVLLVTMHHIICDGWSLRIFIREALALYEAFSSGRPSPLPELPIQYTDFVSWQRQRMQGEMLDRQLEYWKQQLADLPVLELRTDRPRPVVQSFRGGTEHFIVLESLSDGLKSLSRHEGVTLFMTLLAVFQTLLYRYTGQEDMVVGTATAGRKRAEFEALIGVFANALVLRTDLSGNPTFRELLHRVHAVCQAAYAHDDVPFEKLVEVLRPKRDSRWTPLFRVMFRLIPSLPVLQNSLFAVTPMEGESGATGFDLSLSMMDMGELKGCLVYSTDLFEAATVRCMVAHFRVLAETIVADPDARLLSLRCLSDEEERGFREKRNPGNIKEPLNPVRELKGDGNLTGDQLAIWTAQKLQPDVPLYNLAVLFTIWKNIDLKHFQSAFQTLLNSSEVMRSVIEEKDGLPQRRVVPNFSYTMEYLDFSLASDPDAEARIWACKRSQISFDLATRLFDSVLIKLSEKKFVWYLCQHHIITDAWSVRLIFDAVAELYKDSVQGRLAEKVQLPPFQNYVEYGGQHQRSSKHLRAQSYWNNKLQEEIETIAFYGKPPLIETTDVKRVVLDLGIERSQKLQALAAQQGVATRTMDGSLFNIFGAILCTYLYRISGKRRFAFGVPFHNRRSKVFKETIGLFVEVLPIHLTIDEDDNFLSLLRKVKNEVFETLRHSPYAINNNWQKKIYDVVLNYHNMSRNNYNGAPIGVEAVHTGHGSDAFGLRILDFNKSGNLTLEFDFHRDVFGDEQINWAVQHFLRVMDAFIEGPARPLHEVSLLSADEERRLLVEFNQTETAQPDRPIQQLFETQVEITPDAVAVVFEDQQLTYRELNDKANQLAHYLLKHGTGPDLLIAVCLERSLDLMVGLLGILKSGAAYLPLDVEYPRERLEFMINDSRAILLLTQSGFEEDLPDFSGQKIFIDKAWNEIARESDACPSSELSLDHLAYVIYTSGSTGKPKGAMITHRGLANYLQYCVSAYPVAKGRGSLVHSTIAFDATITGLFAPLLVGRAVYLLPKTDDIDALSLTLRKLRDFSIVKITPAHLALLNQQIPVHEARGLTHAFIIGGENLTQDQIAFWQANAPETLLFNEYGPTETVVGCVVYEASQWRMPGNVPIGRPISNTKIYILDQYQQPVVSGISGELYIGGAGVARGYLNRAELTTERFVKNPFIDDPQSLLYKTGDLVRHRQDGQLEFIGRIDNQVKIRGFRIELGEIEAVLGQHPAIRDAVVLALEDTPGDRRLAAYIVPAPGSTPSANELRSFIRQKLPEYMVPSAFMLLEAIPLTPNGKVDRRALPAPDHARPERENVYVAPRTPVEELLTGIWGEVLGVERVGVFDSFFELGGHSLQAVQVVSKMSAAMKLEIPVRLLFLHPTVADLAHALADNLSARQGADGFQSKPLGRANPSELIEAVNAGPSAGFLKIEHRPLLSLHAAGALAPIDAAALSCLPDSFTVQTGLTREQIIHEFCNDRPLFTGVLQTFWGRIGIIILPVFNSKIYADKDNLTRQTIDALKIAGRLGARNVSFTGLIPSATDYGLAVATAIAGLPDVPMITTGHATTAAAVVLAIKRIAQEADRDLNRERVGFLGLGSIGSACLRLMLRCLPHPEEIILCDIYNKQNLLQEIRNEIVYKLGFGGFVRILESRAEVPPEFYESTLIVGATNVSDILNISHVRSGVIIVDDSGPHCFALEKAIRRFQKEKDILFTEGGMLRSPQPIYGTLYLTSLATQFLTPAQAQTLSNHNPFDITGCVFSSLLSTRFEDMKPTVGLVDVDASARHYETLTQLEFRAADLHCENYALPQASIQHFRENFGGSRTLQGSLASRF